MEMPVRNPAILARKAGLVARLQSVLPKDAIIEDEAETRVYECDALTAYKCPPLLAVLPSSTQEVSDVLRICHEEIRQRNYCRSTSVTNGRQQYQVR